MPIQLTGSLDITGSILINGTAVTASGGDGGGFNPITNLFGLLNDLEGNTVQTLDVNAGGVFELHISASGLHKIDASSISTPTASLNIYWYPDSFTSGSQAAYWLTLNSGSGTGVAIRSLISSSVGDYFAGSATPGNTSFNTTRQSTGAIIIYAYGAAANPAIFTVMEDGRRIFGQIQTPLSQISNFTVSGNQGTPLT
jgi:hypothetical protein